MIQPYYTDDAVTLYCGDALEALRELKSGTVQTCVTSPPYWQLRDYGVDGQIGMEPTPEEYVANLVAVFREVWRVLRDDGTVFLNLGDSYFSGARRAVVCGTSDTALEDCQVSDCLCENLCDACRRAYRIGRFRTDDLRVPKPSPLPYETNLGRKGLPSDHLPTLDSSPLGNRNVGATLDSGKTLVREDAPPRVSPESTTDESCLQHPGDFRPSGQLSGCQLCGCSLTGYAQVFFDRTVCICDTEMPLDASSHRTSDMVSSNLTYPHYTTKSLKKKDLVGIPWRVAFALQSDGWYLRSDIIWHKPNPMPESVTDRPTRSHEYIFLLTKNERYFYDHEAIREPAAESSIKRWNQDVDLQEGSHRANGGAKTNGTMKAVGGPRTDKQRGHSRRHAGFNERWDGMTKEEQGINGRNKRDVWTVVTKPFSGSHFATFPPDLIKPCILAGSRPGDVVLDQFAGALTTNAVATELGRRSIGIELNSEYIDIGLKRLAQTALTL